MILRRLLLHVRSENWFTVFLEFVVVVAGLFIGLQIDTWWESRQEAKLEYSYLLEIREDFESNSLGLEETLAGLDSIIQSILILYEQSASETPSLSVDELNNHVRSIIGMYAFIPVSRAYSNMTGSGDLRLIRSRPLKNALAEYYAASEMTMLVQNTHEMELVQIYEPYIIEELDYAAVQRTLAEGYSFPPPLEESRILAVLSTRNFRNILTQKWVITTDLLNQQRNMLARTKEVLELIEMSSNE